MDIQLKDLLISIFFEGALSFLWIGVLVVAWRGTAEFVEDPLKATAYGMRCLWVKLKKLGSKNASIAYVIIPLIIALYPVGVIMHRVSDEFVETTSRWMPKPAKAKCCISCDADDFWDENLKNCVLPICGYKPLGDDGDIKEDVMEKYCHLLGKDRELVESNGNLQNKRRKNIDKVIRDTRKHRAFGDEESRPYVNSLLESVRISQAVLMHSFLLAFILFFLACTILINRLAMICERDKTSVWPGACLFIVWVVFIALLTWAFFIAPWLHDRDEFNYPVFLVFIIVVFPLVFIGWKIPFVLDDGKSVFASCNGTSKDNDSSQNKRKSHPVLQLFMAGAVALIFCYWATFAWAEHRENFWEAVLVLGWGDIPEFPQPLKITLPTSKTD